MADRQPYRIRPGVRYFLDADGFCWQEIQDTGHGLGVMHSMARVNPDNSPTPEPYLYLIPEDELPTWLLVPWWSRLSWWLRPYWHGLDRRVWRWQRKPCRYVVTGGSTETADKQRTDNAHSQSSGSGVHAANKFPAKDGLEAVSRPPVVPAPLPE